jgi:hypothetical protein
MSGACTPSSASKQTEKLDQDADDEFAATSSVDKQE